MIGTESQLLSSKHHAITRGRSDSAVAMHRSRHGLRAHPSQARDIRKRGPLSKSVTDTIGRVRQREGIRHRRASASSRFHFLIVTVASPPLCQRKTCISEKGEIEAALPGI